MLKLDVKLFNYLWQYQRKKRLNHDEIREKVIGKKKF